MSMLGQCLEDLACGTHGLGFCLYFRSCPKMAKVGEEGILLAFLHMC